MKDTQDYYIKGNTPSQLQWLWDNLISVRREASGYFRNKKREYLKGKINYLATNCKNKNIRDLYGAICKFKRGYEPSEG
jgi:hypothetical protein